ncbi:RHS repeat-associated core domain-containing protein [Paraburkholderia terricola]|uniref:RHS repeat-associated core domain-containing protein n=1 Tax=Paraburkholderia terricola TaxID=169427 RepID=UPI000935E54A|nr:MULTISPECIES: RHS repeat-associated core domain-containing protein [Paraburkholderia]
MSFGVSVAPRNPIRFQGQQLDEETGLAYNRHRYYDLGTRRFMRRLTRSRLRCPAIISPTLARFSTRVGQRASTTT